ncbi:MAG TPA: exonuclease SbcCD subunit D C-terminal domain-containing protein [Kofleriaceae bacterium]|nr:exonuclease SbcCD subunit D C-terminal domain-containing protein [Kofleriaceae bacterium]
MQALRLVHTSDWHLGHTLRGEVAREYEHAAFLAWLLETCVREAADALVITGDVFDSATPPASAERMWFELLAALRRARPAMDVIAIAGNHDSPARLGAASSVLRELGVFVVGGLPRLGDGALDLDRILIPVAGGRGLVAAVPFVRPVDLVGEPEGSDGEEADPLGAIYREVIAGARARRRADQALIVTGHLYVAGAETEYLSERRVVVGGQESASLRMFPDDIDYVALGHIHRAQRVGRAQVRYAGAPLPLSLDEAGYNNQVVVVDFQGGRLADLRSVSVPRAIEIVRVPRRGAAPLAEVLAELRRLPLLVPGDPARPYLEVVVALDRPEPKLRGLIEAALDGKRPRLIRLATESTGHGDALGDRVAQQRLAELDPREVFVRLWSRDHAEPPDDAVLAGFDRLLAEIRGDREDLAS